MTLKEIIEGIIERVSMEEALCSLAEEASELSKAALKYRRTLVSGNPTPVSRDTAYENLLEELSDVLLCTRALEIDAFDVITDTTKQKAARWFQRLQDENQQNPRPPNGEAMCIAKSAPERRPS